MLHHLDYCVQVVAKLRDNPQENQLHCITTRFPSSVRNPQLPYFFNATQIHCTSTLISEPSRRSCRNSEWTLLLIRRTEVVFYHVISLKHTRRVGYDCACTCARYAGMYEVQSWMNKRSHHGLTIFLLMDCMHYYAGIRSWKCWRPDREAQDCNSVLFWSEKLHQESSPLYRWWQRKWWWSSYIQGTCYSSKLVPNIDENFITTICKHLYKGSTEKIKCEWTI